MRVVAVIAVVAQDKVLARRHGHARVRVSRRLADVGLDDSAAVDEHAAIPDLHLLAGQPHDTLDKGLTVGSRTAEDGDLPAPWFAPGEHAFVDEQMIAATNRVLQRNLIGAAVGTLGVAVARPIIAMPDAHLVAAAWTQGGSIIPHQGWGHASGWDAIRLRANNPEQH